MGKGIASAHRAGESQSSEVPIVGVDYAFTGSKQQKSEEKGSPVMVIKDKRTQRILARMVPQKGRSKYAIKKLSRDIDQLGYKKVILKSDNEEALLALESQSRPLTLLRSSAKRAQLEIPEQMETLRMPLDGSKASSEP